MCNNKTYCHIMNLVVVALTVSEIQTNISISTRLLILIKNI